MTNKAIKKYLTQHIKEIIKYFSDKIGEPIDAYTFIKSRYFNFALCKCSNKTTPINNKIYFIKDGGIYEFEPTSFGTLIETDYQSNPEIWVENLFV